MRGRRFASEEDNERKTKKLIVMVERLWMMNDITFKK